MFYKHLFIVVLFLTCSCSPSKNSTTTVKENKDSALDMEGVWKVTGFEMSNTAEESTSSAKDKILDKVRNIGELEFGGNHIFKAPGLYEDEKFMWKLDPASGVLTLTGRNAATDILMVTDSSSGKTKLYYLKGRIGTFQLTRVR